MKTIFLAVLAALVFAGCATGPKIDWAARVGHFTYNQAVLELGPPDKVAQLDNASSSPIGSLIRYAYTSGGVAYGYYRVP